ncbi:unnamed protein product [Zymoseptoria tritici ST99CH_1E4]|uniref:Major facilitator superfamily (MFS) profile domain-containing protein n=1 Tax=Zymoseptoria tritici ST99CH_1E4 TaxID=1276532 RepID=A0A2H1GTW2_ZYMTR|nr:unnamed protein product [Zymoseptoria tritici ST99CH_1E4]
MQHAEDARPAQTKEIAGWRLAVIFFCLSILLLLSLMDETIVATALVAISIEFNNFQTSLWIVLGYTLTYLGFAVLSYRLADVYGRRLVVLFGAFIFTAFSTLQGVGGSIMYSITIICFPEMSPVRLLPLASSIIGIVLAISGAVGPALGGVITSHSSGDGSWMNPPVAVPTMLVLYFIWPADTEQTRGTNLIHVELSQVDFVGAAPLLLFTTALTFGCQEGGSRAYSWSSPVIVALLAISGILFVALLAWAFALDRLTYFKDTAEILPWRILTDRILLSAITTTLLTGFTGLLLVIQLPIYFQIVNVLSAVESATYTSKLKYRSLY